MVHGSPVHISSTQILPAHSVLRLLCKKDNKAIGLTSSEIKQQLGDRSMRAYEIGAILARTSIHEDSPDVTEEERALWDSYVAL